MPPHQFTLPKVIIVILISGLQIDCFLLPSLPHPTRQTRTTRANIDIQLHRSQSMTSPSSSATNTAINHYKIRPYNPHTDRIALEEICATVYNGKDYLPQMAESYAADPLCSFLALTAPADAAATATNGDEEKVVILAVANYKRLPSQKCAWIEAVRTHPLHRNRGLASLLLRELIHLSTVVQHSATNDDGTLEHPTTTTKTTLLTCTIQSNVGMQRALEKVGFTRYRTIPALSFETLKQLPGWSSDVTADTPPPPPPQPLLTALHLHHLISPEAKKLASSSSRWRTITNDNELLFALNTCRHHGNTSGYLPGLYEYIVPTPSRKDLRESMQRGLVMTLHPCENPHHDDDGNDAIVTRDSRDMAILALIQDERISTLQSKWVCSIVAYTKVGFEAALLYAHSSEVAKRMRGSRCVSSRVVRDDTMEGGVDVTLDGMEDIGTTMPFCLVFDDAVPLVEGTLAHALPRVVDECWVYSYVCEE